MLLNQESNVHPVLNHSTNTNSIDDYDTPDGTGVRDYIHVCDLAAKYSSDKNFGAFM